MMITLERTCQIAGAHYAPELYRLALGDMCVVITRAQLDELGDLIWDAQADAILDPPTDEVAPPWE